MPGKTPAANSAKKQAKSTLKEKRAAKRAKTDDAPGRKSKNAAD